MHHRLDHSTEKLISLLHTPLFSNILKFSKMNKAIFTYETVFKFHCPDIIIHSPALFPWNAVIPYKYSLLTLDESLTFP